MKDESSGVHFSKVLSILDCLYRSMLTHPRNAS